LKLGTVRKTLWLRDVLKDEKNSDKQWGKKKIMKVKMTRFA
jgi:hypothetical protein